MNSHIFLEKHSFLRRSIFFNPLWLGSHLALAAILLLWFSPYTHSFCQQLDNTIFYTLNGSLAENVWWQRFWGILNHRRETLLNLVFAALINLFVILTTKEKALRNTRIKQTIYFWVCFQLGFMLQDWYFNHYLFIERASPTLVLKPAIRLSALLQNPLIKDVSEHTFPGGHAFSMVYWASFTLLCAPKKIALPSFFIAMVLTIARLFSGAHWASDVIFSSVLALVWLSWTVATPVYRTIIKKYDYPTS